VVLFDEDDWEDSLGISSSVPAVVRCPRCGNAWPSSLATCPDDGAELGESTRAQDLHALETAYLPATRERWSEGTTADDATRIDQRTIDGDTGLHMREVAVPVMPSAFAAVASPNSREFTVAALRAIESAPPPTAQPASDPTTSTKLDPGAVNLVPGTLVGEYEIEKLLGSGGMGAVYGAKHEKLGRRAAIKVISPSLSRDRSAIERFEQEAIALARLSHPNIVNVLSVGTLPGDGRSYYAMEWLDGESLQARIDRGGVTLDDALDILDQTARGLEAAHAAGVIHRDLKPDNVWLQRVGEEPRAIVKILDFGLAKLAQHRRTEETAVNVMFGTAAYMSPEQCQSARDVGPPTDGYALGCVAYELLCGRLPFTYDTFAELIVAHGSEDPPRPRELNPAIDPQLDELLFTMLAKNPNKRPSLAVVRSTTAAARSRAAIMGSRATEPQVAAPVVLDVPASSRPLSRRALLAGAGLALIAIVVVVAFVVRDRVDDQGADERARATTPIGAGAIGRVAPASERPPPMVVHAPVIDAGATPRGSATAPIAPATTREARATHEEPVPVDAAHVVAAEVDAGHPVVVDSGAKTEIAPLVVQEPAVKQPEPQVPPRPPSPQATPPKAPNPNRTFNPFKRTPSK
jgi:serine/threonine-protein kinase